MGDQSKQIFSLQFIEEVLIFSDLFQMSEIVVVEFLMAGGLIVWIILDFCMEYISFFVYYLIFQDRKLEYIVDYMQSLLFYRMGIFSSGLLFYKMKFVYSGTLDI